MQAMQVLPSILEKGASAKLAENADLAGARISSERTDAQLAELIVAGDATAFEQLFDRYKKYVARIAGKYFSRPEEVEEIIQIAFAKVFVEIGKFRGDHEFSMPGWLRRITANACIDQLRSRKRKPEDLCCDLSDGETSVLEGLAAASGPDSETVVCDRDLAEKLLGRLVPEDRAVLEMLHAEEMSVAEIGKVMGWSSSKVKIRAWRARRSLTKVLGQYL